MLRDTDYLMVIDQNDFNLVDDRKSFKVLKTQFQLPQFDLHCVWHARKTDNPAHRWYRDYIIDLCKLS
jgi:hypothetical protein